MVLRSLAERWVEHSTRTVSTSLRLDLLAEKFLSGIDPLVETHVGRGGYFLSDVAFVDDNNGEAIDLGEVLEIADRCLEEISEKDEDARHRFILLRRCRIDGWKHGPLFQRISLVAYHCHFTGAADLPAEFAGALGLPHCHFQSHFRMGSGVGGLANFDSAEFQHPPDFTGADFRAGVSVANVHFPRGAVFRNCRFGLGSNFRGASMEDADLRGARGFRPDETLMRGVRLSAHAPDSWSQLRANYTGPRLAFNLMFLAIYFVPLIAHTAVIAAIGNAEARAGMTLMQMENSLQSASLEQSHVAEVVRLAGAQFRQRLAGGQDSILQETTVWRAVLGIDRGASVWLPVILLLLYNCSRAVLTYRVAPLRDDEERSGVSPRYLGKFTESYGWLIPVHRLVRLLFLIAAASLIWRSGQLLGTPIWLP
ncbi:MAG: hypothetical protein GC161_07730 [Planctomycetaceae bacterium]|nr:hypothetical protein [Planctomycetaceae bacterium]